MLTAGVYSRSARAAAISYGNFGPVPPGITFINVTESSGTDPVPLFGPPTPFTTGLDFDPLGFVATATNGDIDITDGQLNFAVAGSPANSINTISLFEAGDYSLTGVGTPATQALAGAIIRVTVTEINGVPVAPVVLAPINASVGFNLVANPGLVQPWSLGLTVNVDAQLPAGQDATRVEVAIDNQLQAISQPASASFIAKKEFIARVTTGTIPEPASVALLALLAPFALRARRTRL